MAISAKLVKELRDKTGAGMMDAKKALEAVDGDMQKAEDYLRENGQTKAEKKAKRIAAEGLAKVFIDGNKAVILEVNSETDFVARNEVFQDMLEELGKALLEAAPATLEEAFETVKINGDDLKAYMDSKIAVIGEKLDLRRFTVFEKSDDQSFADYIHMGGALAVLAVVNTTDAEVARNIALHIGGMAPKYLSEDDVPSDIVAHEREVLTEQSRKEGKPENIIERMVSGRMRKFFAENTLVDQEYLMDNDMTVQQYLDSKNASVEDFRRYKVGEGIEKKEEDFAAEVEAEMNKNK